MSGENGRLLTAAEVAARWQIKPATVYAMTRAGQVPAVRLGRLYRYRLAEIEQFEAAGGASADD